MRITMKSPSVTAPAPRKLLEMQMLTVNTEAFDYVMPALVDAKAKALIDAYERYLRTIAASRDTTAAYAAAPAQVTAAQAEHRQAVIAATLAGTDATCPDTAKAVTLARANVRRAKDQADAIAGVLTASAAQLRDELLASSLTLIPWLAQQRLSHYGDPVLGALAYGLIWPALDGGPTARTLNTAPDHAFSVLNWPPSYLPITNPMHRQDKRDLNEWQWAELAAGRFDIDADRRLTFHRTWPS